MSSTDLDQDDIIQLIEKWIARPDELPASSEKTLRDLKDCILGEGEYSMEDYYEDPQR